VSIRLTNSEAKGWKRCKRKWYLGQYRGLGKKTVEFDRPLSIGTRMHNALEDYYQPGLERDPERVMKNFWDGINADLEEHPALADDLKKEADKCDAMLTGYFEWLEEEGLDADLEVVSPETEVEVPLIEGATLLSKIDVSVRKISDDKLGNLEHKTTASLTDPVRRLQVDTQLLTEHLVLFLRELEVNDEATALENRAEFVLYNMLKKSKRTARAKPPFFARHEVRHGVQELRSHWQHVAQVAREILDMRVALDDGADPNVLCYPNPIKDCTWDCDFADACLGGMFDDGSDVEAYLAEHFEVGDPLARYRKSVGLPEEGIVESSS
jgi:hypothetical protein